ncbi:hypothetical protein HE1_00893 [Holospora elegans E1]|uniref:Uncharacterized protein n=1 Tax=Holospora elegans E1 TaxID=1427503 RepID=A0A023DZN1_9PROT|nr:hypothetical protein [Holospora elegans]GAJ46558.1 hypothetical protein HE1_00893 [Holospora elegans E1]
MGIGGATMSTTPGGSGSTNWPVRAEVFGNDDQVVQGKFKITNTLYNQYRSTPIVFTASRSPVVDPPTDGYLLLDSDEATNTKMTMTAQPLENPETYSCTVNKIRVNTLYVSTVEGTTTTAVTLDPVSVEIKGIKNDLIDFGQKGEVRNKSGFSWNVGVLIQKTLDSYTMGGRCTFGGNKDSSQLKYKTGTFEMNIAEDEDFSSGFEIPDQSRTGFRLRNKWFAEFIFEFGCVIARRLQLFVGPGIVLQKQELSCMEESRQSPSSLSKTIMGGVLACGTRYALNRHVALGLEYQRQCLGKKNWDNVASIVPQDMYCCGTPVTKTNANLFLVTLSCVFFGK